jgi:hypothetical protein
LQAERLDERTNARTPRETNVNLRAHSANSLAPALCALQAERRRFTLNSPSQLYKNIYHYSNDDLTTDSSWPSDIYNPATIT